MASSGNKDVQFGKLLGIVEGMDKKLDMVTEHFVAHAREDNLRFENLTSTAITNKTRLHVWGSVVSALVIFGVAILGYLIK